VLGYKIETGKRKFRGLACKKKKETQFGRKLNELPRKMTGNFSNPIFKAF
jgi:hypothetical protein